MISIRSQGEEVFSLRSTAERTGRQRPTFDFHPTSRLKAGKLLEEVRAQPQVEKNKTRAAPPVSAVEGGSAAAAVDSPPALYRCSVTARWATLGSALDSDEQPSVQRG